MKVLVHLKPVNNKKLEKEQWENPKLAGQPMSVCTQYWEEYSSFNNSVKDS